MTEMKGCFHGWEGTELGSNLIKGVRGQGCKGNWGTLPVNGYAETESWRVRRGVKFVDNGPGNSSSPSAHEAIERVYEKPLEGRKRATSKKLELALSSVRTCDATRHSFRIFVMSITSPVFDALHTWRASTRPPVWYNRQRNGRSPFCYEYPSRISLLLLPPSFPHAPPVVSDRRYFNYRHLSPHWKFL